MDIRGESGKPGGKSPATRILEGAKKAYNMLLDEGYQPEEITYIADFIWKIANVDSQGLY